MRDERTNIPRGRVAEVDHDVRVDVGDLSVADAKALEPALVDQTARANALDLLEDRPGARVNLEPRVTGAAPAQVFLHDTVHGARVATVELERHAERDLVTLMENARIVTELHVRLVNDMPLAPLIEQLGGLEDLFDEHGSLSLRRRRKEVQVLPDRSANRARNTDVVLEARPTTTNHFRNQVAHDHATFAPHSTLLVKAHVARCVSNDEPPESTVSHEDVGTESEHEVGDASLARGDDRVCEIVCGG